MTMRKKEVNINMEKKTMQNKTKYYLLIIAAGMLIMPGCSQQKEQEELQANPDFLAIGVSTMRTFIFAILRRAHCLEE